MRHLLRVAPLVSLAVLLVSQRSLAADPPEVIPSAKSGPWSAAETWTGGKVPAAGARVHVLTGHKVTYDASSPDVIRCVNVAGTLSFAMDRDTLLNVGLLKVQASDEYSEEGFDCDAHAGASDTKGPRAALEIGSPLDPLPANRKAVIRLHAVEGLDPQSCPALVTCGGRVDLHGAPLARTWLKLAETAKKGAATVTLSEEPRGWRVGDRLIVTATEGDHMTGSTFRPNKKSDNRDGVFTEERTVAAIEGAKITLNEPLKHEHLGEGELRGEVANLSRNIVVESAAPDGVRGHTMYHRGSAGSLSYVELRHLGKENVLGRYSLHFHLVGNSMRGSSVIGLSIWDSHNRWLTVHGTNYLVVRDCVGYQSVGHGFFLEDGTEVYNVFDRNLAVQAFHGKKLPKQVLPFDGNEGAGFWWTNSLNTFTRNVTCENDRYGYRFEATHSSSFDIANLRVMQPDGTIVKTDVRTLPFVRFEGNEAHCDGLYGINLGEGVNRVGPDTSHPFVMRDTKIWEVHYAFRTQSPSVLCDGLYIESCAYGIYHPNFDHYVLRNVKILRTDAEPFNRGHDDLSIQYGPLTVDGLVFTSRNFGGQMPFIQMTDNNPNGKSVSHFKNVKVEGRPEKGQKPLFNLGGGPRPTPTSAGTIYYLHDHFGPGRHAKIVSTKAKDLLADGGPYKAEAPLTGDESRVAEVAGVEFPVLLTPVDDLPPATVVTQVSPKGENSVLVRGIVSDNGEVKRVVVNGREAKLLSPLTGEWEIELPRGTGPLEVKAHGEDAAGNVEKLPHVAGG